MTTLTVVLIPASTKEENVRSPTEDPSPSVVPPQLTPSSCGILFARAGASSGRRAINLVHADMAICTAGFAERTGVDVRPDLPSEAELTALFAATPTVTSMTREGDKFTHRLVEIDLRAHHSVYLVYVTGSGFKLDQDLRQPSLRHLANVVRRIRPGVVFAKRIYRFGRDPWASEAFVNELNELDGYLGDCEHGFQRIDSLKSMLPFLQAIDGEAEGRER